MSAPLWMMIARPRLTDGGLPRQLLPAMEAASPALRRLIAEPAVDALLSDLAAHSPFLWQLACADMLRLERLLDKDPSQALDDVLESIEDGGDLIVVGRSLRRARQTVALLVALADLGGVWILEEVTAALSRAADVFVRAAFRTALRHVAATSRGLRLPDARDTSDAGCGLAILALGKLGAGELNYSSDVDLIAVYDPASALPKEGVAPGPVFVRVVQTMARLLSERTADGHVLRVDLRLRPDPGSTAVAMAVSAAFAYYEAVGQNWERAALIKARAIAGDVALGEQVLRDLAPFIWRRYFDYAAIADIHAMKRQIHAVRGGGDLAVAGHNIKLGRGGIREIEFFVQTQQLIFGGKRPALRGRRTLDMLEELHAQGWVSASAATELAAAYRFLRTLEHRLQMVSDAQTHRIPTDPSALESLVLFCGYETLDAFARALGEHQRQVVAHYALLFEGAPSLDAALGSLVFTGVEDDPETLDTLARKGFRHPARATETIRGWHFGRRPAVRSARARERLTELVPALLDAFARSGDPDAALAAFDDVLGHMPAASELFARLTASASLRTLFADVLGGAPPLARVAAQRPHLLDGALATSDEEMGFDSDGLAKRIAAALATSRSEEEELDAIREVTTEERFAIGLRLFSGRFEAEQAALAYTALAEVVVAELFTRVEARFAGVHGRPAGGAAVVVALGRFGAAAMTATSDLDLMLIYDFAADAPLSDGARPLHAVQYYTRLTQRLLSALTVATRRGRLYDVDLRLRPSGRQGPLATQLSAFRAYQDADADTWERMALTRARVVAGPAGLAARTHAAMSDALLRESGHDLGGDVRAMRRQVAAAKGESDVWDLKQVAGGILDLDFVAQYLQLRDGASTPGLRAQNTAIVLDQAQAAGLLGTWGEILLRAQPLYEGVLQMMRLVLDPGVRPEEASLAVQRRLAAVANLPDLGVLRRDLADTQASVREAYRALVL